MDWTTTGYPAKHYQELRDAVRYAAKAFAITGSLMAFALVAVFYFDFHPAVAAVALAVFILFGLLGGLAGVYDTAQYVRVMPYYERKLGDISTFLTGYALARYLLQLDTLATESKVRTISSFGFADDLCGESLVWHDAEEGLTCIAALRRALNQQSLPAGLHEAINCDLSAWEQALIKAKAERIRFCVLLMHGNGTSGHEWEVRKGSAF